MVSKQHTDEKDNSIYVGDKPFMNYVTAAIMQFTTHEQEEVIIKARGKHISRAVDVSESVVEDQLQGVVEQDRIETDSELVRNREGEKVRVSTIRIYLRKK